VETVFQHLLCALDSGFKNCWQQFEDFIQEYRKITHGTLFPLNFNFMAITRFFQIKIFVTLKNAKC